MVRSLLFALTLVASLALALMPVPAHAWGLLGHRLVALLAWDDLSPDTRRQIDTLLQGEPDPTLAGIAGWADDLRKNDPALGRESANWHFVNIGEHDCAYLQQRDCPGGNCVVEAIRKQTAILADARRPRAERLQALKFVVHFVGDAHQPLHAGYGHDKGGNEFQINWNGRGTNMHTLWDSRMLLSTGRSEQTYLDHLRTLPRPTLPAMTLPPPAAAWAEQSCHVVTQPDFYPRRAKLEQSYVDKHLPIAERQLRAGGVALAAVLNKALDRH
ncbi:S1/P1 nuclease [Pseudoxanthomonas japonensis]|uniref:S1/P1 nuclease n=1 Tax=Pseudoxanthomonas japonensis TaxID=69284 RepID=UPI000DB469D2|nr:S1/P1 nuclease [Pseudoxanthomonas japonensis]PZQ33647.1 MAG: endonuclease [Stenotrophomonas acidaminiphila]